MASHCSGCGRTNGQSWCSSVHRLVGNGELREGTEEREGPHKVRVPLFRSPTVLGPLIGLCSIASLELIGKVRGGLDMGSITVWTLSASTFPPSHPLVQEEWKSLLVLPRSFHRLQFDMTYLPLEVFHNWTCNSYLLENATFDKSLLFAISIPVVTKKCQHQLLRCPILCVQ